MGFIYVRSNIFKYIWPVVYWFVAWLLASAMFGACQVRGSSEKNLFKGDGTPNNCCKGPKFEAFLSVPVSKGHHQYQSPKGDYSQQVILYKSSERVLPLKMLTD